MAVVKHILGPMILRFTRGLYKYNYTATSKSPHHQRHWFLKARDHMRGFSKTSTEETSVWAPSENRAGPKTNLKPVCSPSTVCTLRTTLAIAEVLGRPPFQTKTLHQPVTHKDASFWLQVGQQKECGHVPYNEEYLVYCPSYMALFTCQDSYF